MLKAAVDGVRDALANAEATDTELGHQALGQAIKRAEDVLRNGLKMFPNDGHLLSEEAELHRTLLRADKALLALERAFRASPQSELIARRLARIYLAKGDMIAAVETLRKGLEFNSSNRRLHFQYAMAIRALTPNADVEDGGTLLYNLQRSFSPNDGNFDARFWYARQLCIGGRFVDAKDIFDELKNLKVARAHKTKVRGVVRDEQGHNVRYTGQVYALRESFGFIRCDGQDIEAYFSVFDKERTGQTLTLHDRVSFEIGFALLGPVAQDVQRLLI